MYFAALTLTFAPGCTPPEVDGDDDDDAVEDPFVRAYAGCTADRTEVFSDGAPWSTGTLTYSDDGDLVEAVYELERGTTTSSWTYGAPHEVARFEFRDPADEYDGDYDFTYTWEDGRLVQREFDSGADGTVDEVEQYRFDDLGRPASEAWDYDGDGVLDDEVVHTWTPDGDGWYGTGEGQDPYGSYTTETWLDADLVRVRYTYEDDRGVQAEWEISPPNPVNVSLHVESRASQLGVFTEEDVIDVTVDPQDRPATRRRHYTYAEEGVPPIEWVLDATYTYDCP